MYLLWNSIEESMKNEQIKETSLPNIPWRMAMYPSVITQHITRAQKCEWLVSFQIRTLENTHNFPGNRASIRNIYSGVIYGSQFQPKRLFVNHSLITYSRLICIWVKMAANAIDITLYAKVYHMSWWIDEQFNFYRSI